MSKHMQNLIYMLLQEDRTLEYSIGPMRTAQTESEEDHRVSQSKETKTVELHNVRTENSILKNLFTWGH